MVDLSVMHLDGDGVPMDKAEAASLYKKVAEGGDGLAACALGLMLFAGDGIPVDKVGAVRLVAKAAEDGFPPAMTLLGAGCSSARGFPTTGPRPSACSRWPPTWASPSRQTF